MRFLVDENIGVVVARWLRSLGYEVFSVYEEARGLDDDSILGKAFTEDWILITGDKDFGEKVYREHRLHHGIVLLRLENDRSPNKIDALKRLLAEHSTKLENNYVVVTEKQIRFARL